MNRIRARWRRRTRQHRPGAALVETALVIMVLLLFIFGIIEFSLYLMVLHTTDVGAMTAARLATVSTADPAATDKMITDKCKQTMGGVIKLVSNGNPTITVSGFDSKGAKLADWRKTSFGDKITVEVDGTYTLVTPVKIFKNQFPVKTKASMSSEAN